MAKKTKKKEDATSMAAKQREIAVSEFFSKNRHLLGFDNPTKALLTTVREAVDNALDACEEAEILPTIEVQIDDLDNNRYRVSITDNGPGIVKSQLSRIFGQLLYGSKFHRLKQSRGQQGIGISAAVMYGQMTTGQPAVVVSKTGKGRPAHRMELQIDTKKNKAQILSDEITDEAPWDTRVSGTSISVILEGNYKGGKHGISSYLRQTSLANPHAEVIFISPKGERDEYPRVIEELPVEPEEIKPHPYGVELGTLMRMLQDAKGQTVAAFLKGSFSRVSSQAASQICETAGISARMSATSAGQREVEALYNAIQNTKLMSPPTNCLSPIGEEAMVKGLYWLFVEAKREADERAEAELLVLRADEPVPDLSGPETDAAEKKAEADKPAAKLPGKKTKSKKAAKKAKGKKADEPQLALDFQDSSEGGDESSNAPSSSPAAQLAKVHLDEDGALSSEKDDFFVTAVTRPPSVYRGNPFQVEAGLFYGKGIAADELARVHRFANRVPLQYQASACAMQKAVISAPWRNYEVQQSRGAMPSGPIVIMVHIASAWVPYTSESKEAIAHYEEILKELRLAIMDCGRRLQKFLRRKRREADELKKRSYINKYLNPIGEALQEILGLSNKERDLTVDELKVILENTRDNAGRKAAKKKSKGKKKKSAKAA